MAKLISYQPVRIIMNVTPKWWSRSYYDGDNCPQRRAALIGKAIAVLIGEEITHGLHIANVKVTWSELHIELLLREGESVEGVCARRDGIIELLEGLAK